MPFDKQCRAADLIVLVEVVKLDPISGAAGTGGPHEVATAKIIKTYKGQVRLPAKDKILIPTCYSFDDSPLGLLEGNRYIVHLKHAYGALYAHLEFNCEYRIRDGKVSLPGNPSSELGPVSAIEKLIKDALAPEPTAEQ